MMTDGAGLPAFVTDAHALADEADRRSGVITREARRDDLAGALARFDATWGVGRTVDLASLRAIAHAGNTVLVGVPEPGRADAAGELLSPDDPPIGDLGLVPVAGDRGKWWLCLRCGHARPFRGTLRRMQEAS